jgi:uncharacterized membrane protein YhaH (DUF805 family)
MTFLSYFFSFNGRITRTQWWIGFAVLFVIGLAMNIYAGIAAAKLEVPEGLTQADAIKLLTALAPVLGVLVVALLLMLAMSLSFNVRRYHDRDKSGWWALLQFVPLTFAFIGLVYESLPLLFAAGLTGFIIPIWQLIELGCLAGTGGTNGFGPDPAFRAGSIDAEIAAMQGTKPPMMRAAPQMAAVQPLAAPRMAASGGPVAFGKR